MRTIDNGDGTYTHEFDGGDRAVAAMLGIAAMTAEQRLREANTLFPTVEDLVNGVRSPRTIVSSDDEGGEESENE